MFRLLGFDVRVRPGFVMFMVLIVVLYGDGFGLWLAGSLAAFTLIHELGHAVAARHHGAQAQISLDFLAGYTSFAAPQPLTLAQRASISFAGPGIHIAAGLAALLAMGVNPFDRISIGQSAAATAIWWAGPVIGVFNLVPVLPLDGGHLTESALERVSGQGAHRAMVWFSLVTTGAVALWCLADPSRRFYLVVLGFLVITQVQMLGALRSSAPVSAGGDVSRHPLVRQAAAAAEAERSAWTSGRSGMLVPGQELSPWFRAHEAFRTGQVERARSILVDDLSDEAVARWWPPEGATVEQLRSLAALLPTPLPTGNLISEHVLSEVLLRIGDARAAGTYAADTYSRTRSAPSALMVAKAAATLGDLAGAVRWLQAAAQAPSAARAGVVDAIDSAPELARIRTDPEVQQLRNQLASA